MNPNRSRVHMPSVAAARLEQEHANPTLIGHLREAAKAEAKKAADGRGWGPEEQARVERQRTLFAMLPPYAACDRLKGAIMQRAYDLMWDGATDGADALLEFLPEKEAVAVLDAWQADTTAIGKAPRSQFYEGITA